MKKLLIVDDIEKNLYLLQVLLEGNGYEVVSAKDGAEALETARRDPPDLIIADILMPVMDGFALCREWKQDEVLKHVPFVFYTATYTDTKDEEFALSLGAERFLVKPLVPNVLIEKLQEVIEEHQAGQLSAPQEPLEEETIYLREYNEALIRKLENKMLVLEERTIKLQENEEKLKKRTHDLGERVKELNCLYSIFKLTEMPDISLAELFQRTVELIPKGWQYPEITCSKLEYDNRVFCSSNFKESEWKQASDIIVKGKKLGFLEVYYLEEKPGVGDGPFLKEEQALIEAISEHLGKAIDRKSSEEEIRDYAQRIESLLEIEKAISSNLDLDEILNIIINVLGSIVPFDSLSVQMIQDNSMEIIACSGFDKPDDIVGLVYPIDPKFPNHRIVTTKEVLVIDDVTQDYPHFEGESDKYKSGKIRSWLGLPLISKETVIGIITLDRYKIIPFTNIETQMGTAIASQAVLAIENANLFKEAKSRLEQLGSLREIDRAITGSVDLRVTLDILLGHAVQQLEIDAAAVLLYKPELQILEFITGQGFRTQVLQFTNLRLGEGFAGQAAVERRIIQIPDMKTLNTGFLRSPNFRKEEFVAYVGVPLLAKGNLTGVLEIYHRKPMDREPEWLTFLETLAGQAAIAIDNSTLFTDLQNSNLELVQAYDATIEGWALALELRDMETEGHSRRVVEMTLKLAVALDIGMEEIPHVRRGALLHDIGKMGVPDTILQKPGELTDEEWVIMRQHPVHAHNWLSQISYLKRALDIPYCHHEKWDGSGYPQGLKGDQIPLPARIFAIVDVWDALGSDRYYRKAWSQKKILTYIREQSGKHFDPRIVEAFFELIEEPSKKI